MSKDIVDKLDFNNNNILLQSFYRLKKKLSNQLYSTEKLAKLNELEEVREKIKQQIIEKDESPDNSVLYTAITNFKKRNE